MFSCSNPALLSHLGVLKDDEDRLARINYVVNPGKKVGYRGFAGMRKPVVRLGRSPLRDQAADFGFHNMNDCGMGCNKIPNLDCTGLLLVPGDFVVDNINQVNWQIELKEQRQGLTDAQADEWTGIGNHESNSLHSGPAPLKSSTNSFAIRARWSLGS